MRLRTAALVIVVALLCGACDWLQWAGGPARTGSNFEPDLRAARVTDLVSSPIAELAAASQPVVAEGVALVVHEGTLSAFDTRTYAHVWSAPLPEGSTDGTALAVDGASRTVFVVVATAARPVLLGFDLRGVRNCNMVFSCWPLFEADLGDAPGPASPPLIATGRVIASGADALYAFDVAGQTNCTAVFGTARCAPLWSAATGFAAEGVGPAQRGDVVYAAVETGTGPGLRAIDAATGATAWTGTGATAVTATPSIAGDGTVFVPAGTAIRAYTGSGCGAAECAARFALVPAGTDPAGDFAATASITGGRVYATRTGGTLSAWPVGGCSAETCEPSFTQQVHAPAGGSSDYAQTPVVVNDLAFVLVERDVEGADHAVLLALPAAGGTEISSWDLGAGGLGAGLASPSAAWGIVYVPTDHSLAAVHPTPIEPLASLTVDPLALAPAFSSSIFDYVLRCAAGTNALSFSMTATPGGSVQLVAPITTEPSASQTVAVPLAENQAAVVQARDAQSRMRQYWIRCLPADFPPITVERHPAAGEPTPGWYLVANSFKPANVGFYAMVLDTNGTPVWYRRTPVAPNNLTPLDRNQLAYTTSGNEFGIFSLETGATRSVTTVGVSFDNHELFPRPDGSFLVMSYEQRTGVDLTGLEATPTPGPNSTIVDCILQEVDAQGQLVWQWVASDHIDPVTETTNPAPRTTASGTVYDVFHCNSIDARPNGDVLVSARHLNAVFEVRRSDGQVVWKMGGKPTNGDGAAIITIENDPFGGIRQMHDARYLPNGNISLFDNQVMNGAFPARGIEYAVDFGAGTAEPVFSFTSPDNGAAWFTGSYRVHPDGHRVVGWGFVPTTANRILTEVDADGDAVLDVHFSANSSSYRSVKVPTTRFDVNVLRRTAGQG